MGWCRADRDAFARSLEALRERDWAGASLVIEHRDAPREGRKPEKGFREIGDYNLITFG